MQLLSLLISSYQIMIVVPLSHSFGSERKGGLASLGCGLYKVGGGSWSAWREAQRPELKGCEVVRLCEC